MGSEIDVLHDLEATTPISTGFAVDVSRPSRVTGSATARAHVFDHEKGAVVSSCAVAPGDVVALIRASD